MQVLEQEDITAGVLRALQADEGRKREQIHELVPEKMRAKFEEFAALTGTKVFTGLENRDLVYVRYALERI